MTEAPFAPAARAFSVLTIHPDFIEAYGRFGVIRSARDRKIADVRAIDLRDYAVDKHASVDAPPYGGGDGMVMRPEPLADAVKALSGEPIVILTSPAGKPWTHADALRFARLEKPLVFVCGRFAGVDQRFVDRYVHEQFSCGDVVLSGGELPALMMVDAILRLIPGVLGHADSARLDSFGDDFGGGLEHPLYTRPPLFEGVGVPDVLLSGDHKKIEAWRRAEAEARTRALRPDLAGKSGS